MTDFLHHTRYQKGNSEKSIATYRRCLNSFFKWYSETNGRYPEPNDITSVDLREYQNFLQNIKGLKVNTINLYIKTIRLYLDWLLEKEFLGRMPSFPKNIKIQQSQPKALTRNEQNRVIREAERSGNIRNIAIIRLLLSCGLRLSELISLELSQLDLGERHGFMTITGKGGKVRKVPVPLEARKAVFDWLAEREKKGINSSYLFPGRLGGHISKSQVSNIIDNLGRFARLELHPHIFRHTCATNLVRSNVDLVTVATILGHSNLATTKVYTLPDEKTMAAALEQAEV